MDNFQFETDDDEFECIECGRMIEVKVVQNRPRPITCEECGTEYSVAKNFGSGLFVTVVQSNLMPEGFDEEFDEEYEE